MFGRQSGIAIISTVIFLALELLKKLANIVIACSIMMSVLI